MNAEVFLDSNVLVYAAMVRPGEELKRKQAIDLISTQNFGTSAQVLQEFYVTVVKKAARPLTPLQALKWIEQLVTFPCQPIDCQLVRIAVEIAERYRISYWDAAVLAAASSLGAKTVFSEDFNDGQSYGSVHVVNPFRSR
jgi:predicted nucleic acid-binding protein